MALCDCALLNFLQHLQDIHDDEDGVANVCEADKDRVKRCQLFCGHSTAHVSRLMKEPR
jgi:hypothetical protein